MKEAFKAYNKPGFACRQFKDMMGGMSSCIALTVAWILEELGKVALQEAPEAAIIRSVGRRVLWLGWFHGLSAVRSL